MKNFFILGVMTLMSTCSMAQSSEAGYPVGNWQNMAEGNSYDLDILIERKTSPNPDYGNEMSCGTIDISDSKGKSVVEGFLTYRSRSLDKDGMCTNTFYFNVQTKQGKTFIIGFKKMLNDNQEQGNRTKIKIVKVTGDFANHPAFKNELYSVGAGNGDAFDPTPWVVDEKELMEALKEGLTNGYKLQGFGNLRQYVNAHAKLVPGRPRYAKCKATSPINIRKKPEANADKIGELPPGTTLYVVDEYNGWVQVRMAEKKYGWVSLGVIALTNTPSNNTTVDVIAIQEFVLGNGKLGPLSLGQSVASLPKSVSGLYDKYTYHKEKYEDDMDGEGVNEYVLFIKGGKKIIEANIENGKIESFWVKEGASFIKTVEGFHVGSSARELFRKKPMQWETYFMGEVFGTSGGYTYNVNSDDVINKDIPERAEDFKQNAVITSIVYRK